MARSRTSNGSANTSAALGFEAKLWLAADKLRSNMDAAEYKHVVLGLIFLKYISDSFEEHRAKLIAGKGDYKGANPEDADEYRAENVFWVPKEGRWSHLQANAHQPTIGKIVDDAMVAIERDNPRLKGVLPKDYARPALDKHRLGELIDLIGSIELVSRAPSPAQQNINQRVLKRHVVVAPPPALAEAYSVKVAPWFEQRIKLAEQSRTLATLRDTLLPKLLTGELSVAEMS